MCFHEMQVFENIFEYIDRLVAIARPRTLIYMAIDGVAPRAKMNQQRSRRFRAAQDREEQQEIERKLREKYAEQGIFLPEPQEGETFDSNVITPGTEFMDRLAIALQWCVIALCTVLRAAVLHRLGNLKSVLPWDMCNVCITCKTWLQYMGTGLVAGL
jgi:5'-3' exonuclease